MAHKQKEIRILEMRISSYFKVFYAMFITFRKFPLPLNVLRFLHPVGDRKKRCRMSQSNPCEAWASPKAKAVVLIAEHALKTKNHFFLCCRARNTPYSFVLPPWEIPIFSFGGFSNFLFGFFAQYKEKAQVHTRYLRAF